MSSPLNIFIAKRLVSFHLQWGDEAKERITKIVQTRSFIVASSVLFASLLVQILTGIILSLHFVPSSAALHDEDGTLLTSTIAQIILLDAEGDTLALPGQIVFLSAKRGDVIPTQSYNSLVYIEQTIPLKQIRTIHAINTHVLMATIIGILVLFGVRMKETVYFKGMWIVLVSIAIFTGLIALLGYILPWDEFSATSFLVIHGIIEQGIGLTLNYPHDLIARIFSLHAILLPILCVLLFIPIKKIMRYSTSMIERIYFFGFLLFSMIIGILFEHLIPILPPADALIPASKNLEPAWFFQPFHGMISLFPADASFIGIALGLILTYAIPFMKSFAMRISLLLFLIATSLVFALIY